MKGITVFVLLFTGLMALSQSQPMVSLGGSGLCENRMINLDDLLKNPKLGVYGTDLEDAQILSFETTYNLKGVQKVFAHKGNRLNQSELTIIKEIPVDSFSLVIRNISSRLGSDTMLLSSEVFAIYKNTATFKKAMDRSPPSYRLVSNQPFIQKASDLDKLAISLQSNCNNRDDISMRVSLINVKSQSTLKAFRIRGNKLSEDALNYLRKVPPGREFELVFCVPDNDMYMVSNRNNELRLFMFLK